MEADPPAPPAAVSCTPGPAEVARARDLAPVALAGGVRVGPGQVAALAVDGAPEGDLFPGTHPVAARLPAGTRVVRVVFLRGGEIPVRLAAPGTGARPRGASLRVSAPTRAARELLGGAEVLTLRDLEARLGSLLVGAWPPAGADAGPPGSVEDALADLGLAWEGDRAARPCADHRARAAGAVFCSTCGDPLPPGG